jgi:hypothetical protein
LLNEIPVALVTDPTRVHVAPPSALKLTSKPWVLGYVLVHVTLGEFDREKPPVPVIQVSPPFGLVIRTVPVDESVDDSAMMKSASLSSYGTASGPDVVMDVVLPGKYAPGVLDP